MRSKLMPWRISKLTKAAFSPLMAVLIWFKTFGDTWREVKR